jgi:serine/threonine-protein kinase
VHEQGIVHGDFKPDNVLINSNQRPVIAGFRLSCLADDIVSAIDSSPAYLTPEQIRGEPVTPASDIYSLGILLYEMVTGDVPFRGETREMIVEQHLTADPLPPGQISMGLDPRIERVTLTALKKDPRARFSSVRAMLTELQQQTSSSPYETLALDRATAEEVRKRRSEIARFQRSRVDLPAAPSPDPSPVRGSHAKWIWITAIAVLAVIVLVLVLVLLS